MIPSQADLPPLPAIRLIICSTPRSSSNALTSWLSAAGFGRPVEAFHENRIGQWLQTKGLPKDAAPRPHMPAYVDETQRLDQINGVFACKIHWHQMERFLLNPGGEALFESAALVFLQRRNLLEQAASMRVAHETGVWFPGDPRHDRQADLTKRQGETISIEHLVRANANWLRLFGHLNRTPLFLTDEDVNLRPAETVERIAALIGRPVDRQALADKAPAISKYTSDRERKLALIAASAARLKSTAFRTHTYKPPQPALGIRLRRGLNRLRRVIGMGSPR